MWFLRDHSPLESIFNRFFLSPDNLGQMILKKIETFVHAILLLSVNLNVIDFKYLMKVKVFFENNRVNNSKMATA